jgi:hypothetical protein
MDFGELFAKAMAAGEDDGHHGLVSLLATDDIDDALSEWGGEPEDAAEDVVDAVAAPSGAPAGAPGDGGETRSEEDQQSTGQVANPDAAGGSPLAPRRNAEAAGNRRVTSALHRRGSVIPSPSSRSLPAP